MSIFKKKKICPIDALRIFFLVQTCQYRCLSKVSVSHSSMLNVAIVQLKAKIIERYPTKVLMET